MRPVLTASAVAVCLAAAGCGGGGGSSSSSTPSVSSKEAKQATEQQAEIEGTVVGVIRDSGNISTLYTALLQAKLVDTLTKPGPYTVFAPTNIAITAGGPKAFGKLLTSPSLKTTLLSHVVAGRHPTQKLKPGQTLKTLGGTTISIGAQGSALTADGKVLEPSATAGNGVVTPTEGVLSGP